MFQYRYPRPAVAVDCVVFGYCQSEPADRQLRVLLIQRKNEPFAGDWAFPGGFLEMDETLDRAAERELQEETGLECQYLEQLYSFSGINRDPRERVLSVAYYALLQSDFSDVVAASDAKNAEWFPINEIPSLAFDHSEIFSVAIQRLRAKVRYEPIGFNLLPEKFTLPQLQSLYESILDRPLDKRNFRKKATSIGVLEDCQEKKMGTGRRPPSLYRFDEEKYREMKASGFLFDL